MLHSLPSTPVDWVPCAPPRLGEGVTVLRPRLVERLQEAARSRLLLISAPAGFGKSTLLRQWMASTGGLRTGGVLVRDEVEPERHPLTASSVMEELERAPSTVHIVAARRAPWPAWLLERADPDEVAALDERELAFTAREAGGLLAHIAGFDVPAAIVNQVLSRTDGWAAGMLLTGLALRGSTDVEATFDGGARSAERHAADYLRSEVLGALDPQDRDFLIRTSLDEELRPALCTLVTGRDDAELRLHLLHERGVLMKRQQSEGDVFSCHRMLRDFLRRSFLATYPEEAKAAAAAAARWYGTRGQPERALEQYSQVDDWEGMLRLVHEDGRAMLRHVVGSNTLRQLRAIPPVLLQRDTGALLEHAALQTAGGDSRSAEETLSLANHAWATTTERAMSHILRASWVWQHMPPAGAARAAEQALDILSGITTPDTVGVFDLSMSDLAAIAHLLRGTARWYLGESSAAGEDLAECLQRAPEMVQCSIRAFGSLALMEAWAGRLVAAERLAHAATVAANQHGLRGHHAMIEAQLAMARVHRERNHLDRAAAHLAAAQALARDHHESVPLLIAAIERARLRLSEGRPRLGLAELREWRGFNVAPRTRFTNVARSTEARLWLATGQRQRATELLAVEGTDLDSGAGAVALQIAVEEHDLGEAERLLASWLEPADPWARIERGVWAAVVERLRGHRGRAVRQLDELIREAEPEGLARVFLDGGPPVTNLVREVRRTRESELLEQLVDATPVPSPRAVRTDDAGTLSDRELDVLRYLPSRLSTTEIASRLYISRNTLKTHLVSIYRKLGVGSRDGAIEYAERQHLA